MNVAVRTSSMGLTVTEAGCWYSTLVRAESKAAAEIEAAQVAARQGLRVHGTNQCVEQLPDRPGMYHVELDVTR